MTQIIACSTREGIVLATDSRAMWLDPLGQKKHFSLKKILPLSSHSALISAGSGVGVEMGLALQHFLHQQKAESIEEIVGIATPFLIKMYGQWMNRRGEVCPPPVPGTGETSEEVSPLRGVYFILGGYSPGDHSHPFPLHLLGSEEEGCPLKTIPASHILLIPRSISMERRLEVRCRGGVPLDDLLSLCKSFLKTRSEEEEVGPPFYFATITTGGYKEVPEEEVRE